MAFGFALAKDLKRPELSFLRPGGLGVDSLLEADEAVVFDFAGSLAFPFPKKSFAVEGWDLGSSFLGAGFASAGFAFEGRGLYCVAAGVGAGGFRVARRLAEGLVMVPYLERDSRGSSEAQSSCNSLVTSERIWRSFNGWGSML